MRNHARTILFLPLSIVLASFGAGCADSTAPTGSDFAEHLDSLYFATVSDSSLSENMRYARISSIGLFEVGAAFRVRPTPIKVTTATGTEQWLAFEFETVQSLEHGRFSNMLIATRDPNVHSYLIAEFGSDGSPVLAVLTIDDTLRIGASRHDGASYVSFTGSHECATPPPLHNPTILLTGGCVTASFSSSSSIEFNNAPGLPPAYRRLSFPLTSLMGERLLTN
jgi:hypothetical protein